VIRFRTVLANVTAALCIPSASWAAWSASDDATVSKASLGDVEWWSHFMRELGWPAAFVLAVAVAVWRVGKWVRPWLEKVAEAHLDLVTHLRASQDKIVDSVDRMCASVENVSAELQSHRRYSEGAVGAIRDDIRALREGHK